MNPGRAALALLLLAAVAPASRGAPGPTRLAVLEFEVASDLKLDRTYFSDLARGAVHRAAPQVFVMTRESTEALLAANGKSMSDCTGECELEVGRKLGADYIISGRITQVGSRLSLTMRLFSTADGQLVETAEARGRSADELLDHTDAAMESLLAPLATPAAPRSTSAVQAGAQAVSANSNRAPASSPALSAPTSAPVAPSAGSSTALVAPSSARAAPPSPLVAPASAASDSFPAVAVQTSAPSSAQSSPAPGSPTPAPARATPESAPAATSTPSLGATITPAPRAALPSSAEREELQATATAHSHTWGYAALGAGVLIGGGSLAFDNLSSTSKDGKLTAIDFLPVAGYAVALALAGLGVYQLVQR